VKPGFGPARRLFIRLDPDRRQTPVPAAFGRGKWCGQEIGSRIS
jgi:hypothetical protein